MNIYVSNIAYTTTDEELQTLFSEHGTVESARINNYVWSNAAAAVDVADADILGITFLAVNRFGYGPVEDAFFSEITNLPYPARMPIEIALAMAPRGPGEVALT